MNFLKGLVFVFFLVILGPFVYGLSCQYFGPALIGEVVDFEEVDDSLRVFLSDLSPLQGTSFFEGSHPNTRFWLLDNYEDQAKKFFLDRDSFEGVEDYHASFLEKRGAPEHYEDEWYASLFRYDDVFNYPSFVVSNKLNVEKGDFLIRGYPAHVCEFGFFGVFAFNGTLKYIYSKGEYPAFRYKGVDIISSGEQKRRGVLVSYVVGGEKFGLFPSQRYDLKGDVVSSILVLEAVVPEKGGAYLWGMDDYVVQIMSFSQPLQEGEFVESGGFLSGVWFWLRGLFSF